MADVRVEASLAYHVDPVRVPAVNTEHVARQLADLVVRKIGEVVVAGLGDARSSGSWDSCFDSQPFRIARKMR